MNKDSRAFTRVFTELPIHVASGVDSRPGTCRDISMAGLFCVIDRPFPAGTRLSLAIPVGESRIRAGGVVIRATAEGMAIEITELSDPESYQHLQRLVLFNSPTEETADRVEDEITRSFGIRRPPADPPA
jgi:hypothetical protein